MKRHRRASHLMLPLFALFIGTLALGASPAWAKDKKKSTCEVRLVKQGSIFLSFDTEDEKDCENMQQSDTQVEIRGKENPNQPQPTPK